MYEHDAYSAFGVGDDIQKYERSTTLTNANSYKVHVPLPVFTLTKRSTPIRSDPFLLTNLGMCLQCRAPFYHVPAFLCLQGCIIFFIAFTYSCSIFYDVLTFLCILCTVQKNGELLFGCSLRLSDGFLWNLVLVFA